jgi:hypothetical protein
VVPQECRGAPGVRHSHHQATSGFRVHGLPSRRGLRAAGLACSTWPAAYDDGPRHLGGRSRPCCRRRRGLGRGSPSSDRTTASAFCWIRPGIHSAGTPRTDPRRSRVALPGKEATLLAAARVILAADFWSFDQVEPGRDQIAGVIVNTFRLSRSMHYGYDRAAGPVH